MDDISQKLIIIQERISGLNWTNLGIGTPILIGSQSNLEWKVDIGKYKTFFDKHFHVDVINNTIAQIL